MNVYPNASFQRWSNTAASGENGAGGLGPDGVFRHLVVLADVADDSVLRVSYGPEQTAPDAPAGDDG